jgi:hypothetical protein
LQPYLGTLFQFTLWLTVPINLIGAVIFSFPGLRRLIGLPIPVHPFYGMLIGLWIGLFGIGYSYLALSKHYDKTFLLTGALGKLSFFALAIFYFLQTELGMLALLASTMDAVLASIFLLWLWKSYVLRSNATP